MTRRDPLGLRQALANRLLPLLVAAMVLLGALAVAGALAAASLSARWEAGAAAAMMLQPPPGADAQAAARRIAAVPGVAEAIVLDRARMADLLRPWLGTADALPLPVLIELRLMSLDGAADVLRGVQAALPGATIEAHGVWVSRLLSLSRTIENVAWAVLALVFAVATVIIVAVTHAGLAARRPIVETLHDMGATDGMIAGRFANRLAMLSGLGAIAGVAVAVPVLLLLDGLAEPLIGSAVQTRWALLLLMPPCAAALAWVTARLTVHQWLRALP